MFPKNEKNCLRGKTTHRIATTTTNKKSKRLKCATKAPKQKVHKIFFYFFFFRFNYFFFRVSFALSLSHYNGMSSSTAAAAVETARRKQTSDISSGNICLEIERIFEFFLTFWQSRQQHEWMELFSSAWFFFYGLCDGCGWDNCDRHFL